MGLNAVCFDKHQQILGAFMIDPSVLCNWGALWLVSTLWFVNTLGRHGNLCLKEFSESTRAYGSLARKNLHRLTACEMRVGATISPSIWSFFSAPLDQSLQFRLGLCDGDGSKLEGLLEESGQENQIL